MPNTQQNNIRDEIEQIKKEIYCKTDLRKMKKVRINFNMG